MAVVAAVVAATGKGIAEAAVAVGELETVKEIAAVVVAVAAGEFERKAKMGTIAAAVEFETETTVAAAV